jgi:isoleucyl-tRNA synthetase
VGAYGEAPFKGIMSCGFVVDGEGRKMAKSLGNGVDPAKIVEQYGADVLRLWVGSVDYAQDVGIDDTIIKHTSESYRTLRNCFRFLLSNLYDFAWADAVSWSELNANDQWALVSLAALIEKVTAAYDDLHFHVAYHAISDYVNELSGIYEDITKDRLYSSAAASTERRAAQTVFANILDALTKMLAPILCFTCDEVWESYPEGMQGPNRAAAIQLAGWPSVEALTPAIPQGQAEQIEATYATILAVREAVTKALEDARSASAVGKSQEAALEIVAPRATVELLQAQPSGSLEELFIVASVTYEAIDDEDAAIAVEVSKAPGEKCPRCWNTRELGTNPAHPDLCERCAARQTRTAITQKDITPPCSPNMAA